MFEKAPIYTDKKKKKNVKQFFKDLLKPLIVYSTNKPVHLFMPPLLHFCFLFSIPGFPFLDIWI